MLLYLLMLSDNILNIDTLKKFLLSLSKNLLNKH